MGSKVFYIILRHLDSAARKNRNPSVQNEILRKISRDKNKNEDENLEEYHSAIGELIDNQYIDQYKDNYAITDNGREYLRKLNPLPVNSVSKFVLFVIFVTFVFFMVPGLKPSRQTLTAKISLAEFVNIKTRNPLSTTQISEWFDPVPEVPQIDVPFDLNSKSLVVETGSQSSQNDYLIEMPVNIQGVVKIHLLINLSYASPKFAKGEKIEGTEICRVWLTFSKGVKQINYFAGKDIRDWIIANRDAVITVGSDVKTAWTGHSRSDGKEAVIDYIGIDVPENFRQDTLKSITIDDRSWEILSNANPGIMVFGVTVEYDPQWIQTLEK